MKNVTFFIILACYYLFAGLMFAFINNYWALYAGIFFVVSILVISLITSVRKNANEKFWDLFKSYTASIMGTELILVFIIRIFLLYKLSNM